MYIIVNGTIHDNFYLGITTNEVSHNFLFTRVVDGGKVVYSITFNSHLDVSTRELKASVSGSNFI